MSILEIITAPHSIFKTKAAKVLEVNDEIQKHLDDMLETMYFNQAVGG